MRFLGSCGLVCFCGDVSVLSCVFWMGARFCCLGVCKPVLVFGGVVRVCFAAGFFWVSLFVRMFLFSYLALSVLLLVFLSWLVLRCLRVRCFFTVR